MNSRKALHERQINEIKAAATPRKNNARLDDFENASPGSASVTPMKRVPLLANFEEWMKMATDNKINATNSWNFALIDYFHDMSLLKEGDGVNFQKASCTLDGCVKIYTNRVDSVATETGKLLSGLADSNSSKKKDREGGDAEAEESEEELDADGNVKKKPKKKVRDCAHAPGTPLLTTRRPRGRPRPPWPPRSVHCNSKSSSSNLPSTPSSRRHRPISTKEAPAACS